MRAKIFFIIIMIIVIIFVGSIYAYSGNTCIHERAEKQLSKQSVVLLFLLMCQRRRRRRLRLLREALFATHTLARDVNFGRETAREREQSAREKGKEKHLNNYEYRAMSSLLLLGASELSDSL